MGSDIRRLLTFRCEGSACAATFDGADGETGVLIVTGGREPRIGAHGWQAALARSLAEAGHATLRFDRRGVGDSAGVDRGHAESAPDIVAAATCLRAEAPAIKRLIGIGNCDGATALTLAWRDAELTGMILLNPWLSNDDQDELPPPSAIRHRYRERLLSPRAWLRLITGRIDISAAFRGLRKAATTSGTTVAVGAMADRLDGAPVRLVISSGDATGIAFASAWRAARDRRTREDAIIALPTRSHSFAAEGDHERLIATCLEAIRAIEQRA